MFSLDFFRKALAGLLLVTGVVVLGFGHTFLVGPQIASADVGAHVDETPHDPDSDSHVPCPTELHQAMSQRLTTDDQHPVQHVASCASVAFFDVEILEERQSLPLPDESDIPPDLPLDQKIVLLV